MIGRRGIRRLDGLRGVSSLSALLCEDAVLLLVIMDARDEERDVAL